MPKVVKIDDRANALIPRIRLSAMVQQLQCIFVMHNRFHAFFGAITLGASTRKNHCE